MLSGSQRGVIGWGKEGPEEAVISFLISEGREKFHEENVQETTTQLAELHGSEWEGVVVERGIQV